MKSKNFKPNLITDVRTKTPNKPGSEYKHQASLTKPRVSACVVCFCCLAFLIVCMLINPVSAKTQNVQQLSVESQEKLNEKLQGENSTTSASSVSKASNSLLRHQLQQARISIYQDEKKSKSKNELKQILEKIRSILFKSDNQPIKSITTSELVSEPESNEASFDITTHEKSKKTPAPTESKKPNKSEHQYEPVSEHTLQMLDDPMQNPDRFENPFELAEVLFLSDHLKEAMLFYKEALKRKDPNDLGSAQEKAWILFQISNCLRSDDLQEAKNTYRQLIAEYPDYPWTELAKVQEKLIDWYLKDKPHTLIKECKKLADEI